MTFISFPDLNQFYFSPRFVHRLDFSTSGALCVALNKKASSAASKEFEARRVKKEYLALVSGFFFANTHTHTHKEMGW